jgi:hypothetical protein
VKVVGPSSRQLLSAADDLLSEPSAAWSGRWPRAVALLTRQALERSMEELWAARAPAAMGASARAQLLCLRVFVDQDLARRAAWTWSALSRACHHSYDLPPTAGELADWLATVDELTRAVGGRATPATGVPAHLAGHSGQDRTKHRR